VGVTSYASCPPFYLLEAALTMYERTGYARERPDFTHHGCAFFYIFSLSSHAYPPPSAQVSSLSTHTEPPLLAVSDSGGLRDQRLVERCGS
jgi:hypothetical protein